MTQEDNDLFPQQERRTYAELLAPCLRGVTQRQSIDWAAVELDLGARLPASYKALAEQLPAGFLGSGITWMSPASPLPDFRLDLQCLSERRKQTPETADIRLHPETPGYLVFAQTSASIDWAYEVR